MKHILISTMITLSLIGTALGFSKKPPNVMLPVAKIQKMKPPLRCDIYLGSNGKYYTETETFQMTRWYEDTPEKALDSAKGALKRYYENENRTYRLIGSHTITGGGK